MCGEKNKFLVFTSYNMELNLVIFIHVLVSLSKAQAEFLENLFPPRAQTGGENYDLHIKIKSENIKVT